MTYVDHWDFVCQHYDRLQRIARRFCKGNVSQGDDVFQEICMRVEGAMNTWRPEGGASLEHHVFKACGWYAWKYVVREAKRSLSIPELPEECYTCDDILMLREEVLKVTRGLSEYEVTLLVYRYVYGMTLDEVGDKFAIHKTTARKHILEALEKARAIS